MGCLTICLVQTLNEYEGNMEWLEWVMYHPQTKIVIITKIENDGYAYPHYSLKRKKTVSVIDVLAIQRDCEKIGIALADVYPSQSALF